MKLERQKSQQEVKRLTHIYKCEKDQKKVLMYNLIKDSFETRDIDMEANFMHNFQTCIVQN